MERASEEAKKLFPGRRVVFCLDNSPVHCAKREDALNAVNMNAKPGGAQPKMVSGWWVDKHGKRHTQAMVDRHGQAKGLRLVCAERFTKLHPRHREYTVGMTKKQLRALIEREPDFLTQPTLVEELIAARGQRVLFMPKFHCELNPTELVWAAAKRHTREHCTFKVGSLRALIPQALSRIPLKQIAAYFERSEAWVVAYREKQDYEHAKQTVQAGAKQRRSARAKANGETPPATAASGDGVCADSDGDEEMESETEPTAHGAEAGEAESSDTENRSESEDQAVHGKDEKTEVDPEAERPRKRRRVARRGAVVDENAAKGEPAAAEQQPKPTGMESREDPDGNISQCFVIAAVQLLLSVPTFRDSLSTLESFKESLALSSPLTLSLVRLAAALRVRRNHQLQFQSFARVACYDIETQLSNRYSSGQNDSTEFLLHLVAHLRSVPDISEALGGSNPFDRDTRFRIRSELACGVCGHSWQVNRAAEEKEEHAICLSASNLSGQTVEVAISATTAPHRVNFACARPECKADTDTTKYQRYLSVPDVLIVHVSRWSRQRKSNNQVKIPLEASFDVFNARYRLLSVALHHGASIRSGHYTAVVLIGDRWYNCNDNAISSVQPSFLASAEVRTKVVMAIFERVHS